MPGTGHGIRCSGAGTAERGVTLARAPCGRRGAKHAGSRHSRRCLSAPRQSIDPNDIPAKKRSLGDSGARAAGKIFQLA
jgi:hypothetical protein